MNYNEVQQEAIQHQEGPMMVLAGPGSGKTTVITKRVQSLIEEHHIDPGKILVITFSKAASVEMKERYLALNQNNSRNVWFGTFHAVFFHILRYTYHYDSQNIITSSLKKRFLEESITSSGYETEDKNELIEDIENEISMVKGEGIDIDCYYSAGCPEEIFRSIFAGYEERLKKHHLIDFDDMIVMAYKLLTEHSNILRQWQERFAYILIDEFQDINRLQYETVKLLAEPENNLFIVGDDDQSIYGFRGAKPGIMLRFPDDFPRTKQVTLGKNYRCSGEIMTAASRLIARNKKRYHKKLEAVNGKTDAVHIRKCKTIGEENRLLVKQILQYKETGIPNEEMAVLFRINYQARSLIGRLLEYNIPFVIKDNIPNIFEHFIAKDILAYIKIALGSRERALFLQIANRPKRYLSREAFREPEVSFQSLYAFYRDKRWMGERLEEFQNDLAFIKKMPPFAAVDFIRKSIGYDGFLEEYARYREVKPDDWILLLDDLQETAKESKTYEEWFAYIDEYGKKLEEKQKKQDEESAGVRLLTMHRAKGLEFDVVFIPDVNEGVTPYRKASLPDELEEERRMFYVGMTRARKHLHLIFPEERYNKECKPSRFLFEIGGDEKGLGKRL